MMRVSGFLIAACAVTLVLSCACGKRQVTKPAPETEHALECRVLPELSMASDGAVTFALLEPVDLRRAPWASHTSDRIVFGHLYETLVTIGCEGEVRPCAAESWTSAEDGRLWSFELRKDARFWDGAPVTARDVAASWRDALTLETVIDSVSAVSDRSLRVYLRESCPQLPRVLSSSVYAVTRAADDSRWPTGSGLYRVGSVDVEAYPAARRTITVHPAFGLAGPVIRFVETSPDRVRDGLESSIDAVVTADPAAIEYAAARTQFLTVALPWDGSYVLLSTSRVRSIAAGEPVAMVPPDVLDGLAHDAVREDARGFQVPSWWGGLTDCDESFVSVNGSSRSPLDQSIVKESGARAKARRIVYDADDAVARGLAERIAALSAADTARSVEARTFARAVPTLSNPAVGTVAKGLTQIDFERSLHRGDEFAYVMELPRQPPDPCYEARALVGKAPWLSVAAGGLADVLIPLVDARSHLIVRKNTVELKLGGNGSILVVPREAGAENTRGSSQ